MARPALPFSQGIYSTRRSHTDVSLNPVTSGYFPHEDAEGQRAQMVSPKHIAIKKQAQALDPIF